MIQINIIKIEGTELSGGTNKQTWSTMTGVDCLSFYEELISCLVTQVVMTGYFIQRRRTKRYLHFFMWTTFFSFVPSNSDSLTLFAKRNHILFCLPIIVHANSDFVAVFVAPVLMFKFPRGCPLFFCQKDVSYYMCGFGSCIVFIPKCNEYCNKSNLPRRVQLTKQRKQL